MKVKTKVVKEDANSITEGAKNYLRAQGHSARRINTTGVWDPVRGVFRKQKEKGTADLLCCIFGRFYAIEVKFKRDTQKAAQKQYQEEVEGAGGVYWIVKTYAEFLDHYKNDHFIINHLHSTL
jgi:hypothetical protein